MLGILQLINYKEIVNKKGVVSLRYLGNKDTITDIIQNLIMQKVKIRPHMVFFDAFCGTGSVANSFKTLCNIRINDNLHCATTYSYGKILGSNCTFDKLRFNPIKFFNNNKETIKGYFYKNYSLGGSNRMYLSEYNASRVDYFRQTIEEWNTNEMLSEEEYSYLLACLIESISFVSNTAGVYGAFLKKWDERALKDIIFIDVSDGINTNNHVMKSTEKIENIIENTPCDILYLDPPYTQNQYGTQYHLLETLVLNDKPVSISKVTGSRSTSNMRSDWSKKYKVHILFDKVIAKTNAQHIFFSYNNDGDMSKDFIESTLKRYAKDGSYDCITIPYKKYKNWKTNSKKEHFEYLFYIEKKPSNQVVYESPLNYIGSKAKIIPQIKENLIQKNTFVDVFGGGFNVGINSNYNHIIYNDLNFIVKDLIQSFQKYDTYDYIMYVKRFIKKYNLEKGNKENYIAARNHYNTLPPNKKDIRILFALILYSFQQQIRFNNKLEYNNPVGMRWFNDYILSKLVSFSRIIKESNVTFLSSDYIHLSNSIDITNNCFVYLDPPYKLTLGSYNDGKRGFKGWDDNLEVELFTYFDNLTAQNIPCMLSYVLEHKGEKNTTLEKWINQNNYTYISLGNIIGISGQPRKEILILNYDI